MVSPKELIEKGNLRWMVVEKDREEIWKEEVERKEESTVFIR